MSDTSTADTGGFDPGRLRTAPTQMLRSRDDRYIAGVGGGLARYLSIDPVVVRVILAALTVVGGLGLVLYVAAWLLAPEEGADKNVLERHLPGSPRIRVLGWIVAGVLAVGAVVGSGPWFYWGWIGPIPLLGLAVLVWVLARPRKSSTSTAETTGPSASPTTTATPAPPTAPATPTPETPASEADTLALETDTSAPETELSGPDTEETSDAATSPDGDDDSEATTVSAADQRPTMATAPLPPTPPPSSPSSDRPRDNGVLIWLTLGALVALIGVMWLVDESGGDVDGPVYVAGSLAVVAVGMLVGTWWGNGRWLIPAGVLLTATLIGVSQLPVWKFGEIKEAPTRSDDVLSSYEMGAGRIELDLTHVEDLAALDGRTITMDNGLGQTEVILPEGLDVTVTADVNAGNVDLLGREANGADASTQYTDLDDADPDLAIEIDQSLGDVKVTRP